MSIIGYARVSTRDQDLSAQLASLKSVGCTQVYREKASGKNADRSRLARRIKQLRPGDCVVVTRLDRLGRGLRDLVNILHDLDWTGVGFRFVRDECGQLLGRSRGGNHADLR